MTIENISSVNNTYIQSQKSKTELKKQIKQSPLKENRSKIVLALCALASCALAGIAIAKGKRSTAVSSKEIQTAKDFLLADVEYNKSAFFKGTNEKFTGVIKDILKNGDVITLEYDNGIIKKSTRQGEKNIEKIYETIDDLTSKITIKDNGGYREFFPQKIKQDVLNSRTQIRELLFSQTEISADEFLNKTKEIQYASKSDKKSLNVIYECRKKEELFAQNEKKRLLEAQKLQQEQIAKNKLISQLEEKYSNAVLALENAKKIENTSFEAKIDCAKKAVEQVEAEIELAKAKSLTRYECDKDELERKLEIRKHFYERAKHRYRVVPFDMSKTYCEPKDGFYFGAQYSNIAENEPEIAKLFNKNSKEYKFYLENKDLDLSSDINLFDSFDKRTFDIPERFAIMADNSLRKTGNAYISEDIPEIFKGLDKEEVLDKISRFARGQGDYAGYKFNIGSKEITAKYAGGGEVGSVYRLSDEFGNSCAVKIYNTSRGSSLDINSGLVEIALSRQFAKDKVCDVAKFYMANAGLYNFDLNSKLQCDTPWMICDYIDDDKLPKKDGIKLLSWLKDHSMHYADAGKNGRTKGGYLLDIGGCVSDNYREREIWGLFGFQSNNDKYSLNSLLEKALKQGMGVEEILKTFQK